MPVYFESNFSYPIEYKKSLIDLLDGRELHYLISTNVNQNRFWVDCTMVNTNEGTVVIRTDLSKLCFTFGDVLKYISELRMKLTEVKADTQLAEMRKDYATIESCLTRLTDLVISFRVQYL